MNVLSANKFLSDIRSKMFQTLLKIPLKSNISTRFANQYSNADNEAGVGLLIALHAK